MRLFNVNACVGRGAYEEPDYPDIKSLISHMDYLGIDRTLVSHTEARDVNPTWGNKRLLREISESGCESRLIPAFVISPACYYERGALDFLKESVRTGKVKALRIYPNISRFPIYMIERVLSGLREWKPAVFWDCMGVESDTIKDFSDLAAKFPEISFVITQKMWPGFGAVIDAMWRNKNIFADISWLHMRDTPELIVENFGAERLLFGVGYKSHYGAAVAALAHYDFPPDQKELIAHGNTERILGVPPLSSKLARNSAIIDEKPLWRNVRDGKVLRDVTVIDVHTHTTPFARGWYMRSIDPYEDTKELVSRMDRLGVQKLVITPECALFGDPVEGSLFWEKILSAYPDRFSGYLVFNPRFGAAVMENADSFFKRGFFRGFKILPSYWKEPASSPGYEPMWTHANKYKLPILSHTWDDSYNSPAMFRDWLKKYPDTTLIMGHSGGGDKGRLEAEAMAAEFPNVFLESCGTFTAKRPFEDTIKTVGGDRVVFGSDTGAHDQAWELGRYLSMPLPDNELVPGLGLNAEKIFARSTCQES
jgi:predicted TIM-barrel fold metal-dependent hydrolase